MPPLPVIADIFRTAIEWSNPNGLGHAANVMHISGPGKTPTQLMTSLEARVAAGMWSWVDSASTIDQVVITPLDGTSATVTFNTSGGAKWTGGSGAATGVPQASGIIKLQTGIRGRSNRGRLFLPWVAENEQSNGILQDVTAVNTAWGNFANGLVTDGFALGVASYLHSNWHQATNVSAENHLGTQRRRNDRIR